MTRGLFYGWVVLAAAFLIITLSIGTLFSLEILPVVHARSGSQAAPGPPRAFRVLCRPIGGLCR